MKTTTFAYSGVRARATFGSTPLRGANYSNKGGKSIPIPTKNKTGLAIGMTVVLGGLFFAGFLPGQWQRYKAQRG
ncbi:hypothetical protein BX616_000493 [Lobosporangium transversale]|uniref:Cytochrome c oxidase subunit 8, mitochondrial n=1 Tax=Lobosporangium transversale TaxID=64571 RepID=A0A1Y2H015_9FUNG|nr:hypothetical protein BCR41DRAFT_418881 [Lobosporangium transversale]KAF9917608.1 hypothetical protein BX616_000493 [Lobosporangium transversale]ORZ27897.1 hypothetical protein BCR41DRAFT_418881 [Lobosporangium transversale]|eukprot:XP_021885600.1 hypothetical protein BCR41DRAFT_418881 [Lobosporangium transversale]